MVIVPGGQVRKGVAGFRQRRGSAASSGCLEQAAEIIGSQQGLSAHSPAGERFEEQPPKAALSAEMNATHRLRRCIVAPLSSLRVFTSVCFLRSLSLLNQQVQLLLNRFAVEDESQ